MIENSTRPYIVVKYEMLIMPDGIERYIVVKNYGQTGAKITEMTCTGAKNERFEKQFSNIKGSFLAPSQRLIYYFGGVNPGAPEVLTFDFTYVAGKKVYSETTTLCLINGTNSKRTKSEESVKYILREMLDRLI